MEMLLSYFLDNCIGSIYSDLSSKNIYYIHVLGSPFSFDLVPYINLFLGGSWLVFCVSCWKSIFLYQSLGDLEICSYIIFQEVYCFVFSTKYINLELIFVYGEK